MTSQQPTLINLPPPPSDPVTPSDIPSRSGTPNSTTTSMSELSTVAIKDGHRGHLPHHHSHHPQGSSGGGSGQHPTSGLHTQLDAERADRISRLAGLERLGAMRNVGSSSNAYYAPPGSAGNLTPGAAAPPLVPGSVHGSNAPAGAGAVTTSYFDASGNPALGRERSTVGSASATGSVGARTTWAGSEAGDVDKMSESQDMDMDVDAASSVGGMSEEGATTGSLVGFGEGARTPARQSLISSPGGVSNAATAGSTAGGFASKGGTPTPVSREAAMIDGLTYDRDVVDTTAESRIAQGSAAGNVQQGSASEEAERIVRENMNTTSNDRMMRGG